MAKIPQLLATKMVQRAVEGDLPIVRNGDLKDTALANRPDIPLSHAMALYRDNSSYQAMVLPCIVDTDAAKSSTITLLTYVDLQAWSTDQLSLVTKLRGGTDVKVLDGAPRDLPHQRKITGGEAAERSPQSDGGGCAGRFRNASTEALQIAEGVREAAGRPRRAR